jgi:hypothetical protein
LKYINGSTLEDKTVTIAINNRSADADWEFGILKILNLREKIHIIETTIYLKSIFWKIKVAK